MRRGEVWFASTPGGDRPVLVLTRDPVADRIRSVSSSANADATTSRPFSARLDERPENVRENAAVVVVLEFHVGLDAHLCLEDDVVSAHGDPCRQLRNVDSHADDTTSTEHVMAAVDPHVADLHCTHGHGTRPGSDA